MYGARRDAEDGKFYWRVTQFMLPFYTSVPGFGGKNRDKVWVPLDDEHTMVWEPHWSSTRELTEEEQKGRKDRVAPSGFLPDTDDWLGKARFAANAGNDFLLDRERQKKVNFSGLENVTPIQDAAMQESMGPIVDRTREHLGASDAAIVQMRRRLMSAARAIATKPASPARRGKPRALPQTRRPVVARIRRIRGQSITPQKWRRILPRSPRSHRVECVFKP